MAFWPASTGLCTAKRYGASDKTHIHRIVRVRLVYSACILLQAMNTVRSIHRRCIEHMRRPGVAYSPCTYSLIGMRHAMICASSAETPYRLQTSPVRKLHSAHHARLLVAFARPHRLRSRDYRTLQQWRSTGTTVYWLVPFSPFSFDFFFSGAD